MKVIRDDISSGNFKRVYLLFGDEEFLIRRYRDSLKKAALGADASDENFSYFDINNIDITELKEMAMTFPFFADRRVIIAEQAGLFTGENGLAEFIPELPDSTLLIITEKSVDKRTKLFKAIKDTGYVCEFARQKHEDIAAFVASNLAKRELRITTETCMYFINNVGSDLFLISNELDKLSAYCAEKDVVTKADIDAVCSMQIENRIFDLVDSIISKDLDQALGIYFNLIALRESPLGLLRFIMKQYNRLFLIVDGIANGKSDSDIAAVTHQPDWVVRKYRPKLRNIASTDMREALRLCADTEQQIKSGIITENLGLELLIETLAGTATESD